MSKDNEINEANFPGLSKLGPLVSNTRHRVWVMPPGLSITALVMRELIGKDDLIASARAKSEEEEMIEMNRQAIVAWSTTPVPMRRKVELANNPEGGDDIEVETEEPDLDRVTWRFVEAQPFPELDTWSHATRKILIAYYNELNGIDLAAVGKSLASGRDWSPAMRTTTEGRSQLPPVQPTSARTDARKPGSSTGGSTSRATRGG
jgi:hypothetical protein